MSKHFFAVFVSVCVMLGGCSAGALARGNLTHNQAADRLQPADTDARVEETGTASYYGGAFHGRLAANGTRFDQEALTAAHPWLPFGTKVRVTLASSGRNVVVTITDRMYSKRRVVDLSVAAARHLGIVSRGLAKVTLVPV